MPGGGIVKSPRNGLGCDLKLGIKLKTRLILRNRRLRWIPGIGEPLSPRFHASEVVLLIDFEN
jgi:hypothetical protein